MNNKAENSLYIPKPDEKIIKSYLNKWNLYKQDRYREKYVYQENSLNILFHDKFPNNTNLEEVLIKCCCLNDFYSTNIFSIYPIAKKICELNIDQKLKEEKIELVEEIANISKKRKLISFASKYCSHHNELVYPIYDSYVVKMLWHFQKQERFSNFKKIDLSYYPKFCDILKDFTKFFKLENFTLKEIDRYLWIAGKEYFKQKYY